MEGGINDLRMGTVDKQLTCKTCRCNFEQCPGHFGHIELCRPVYHVGFIDECRKILKCVCFNCSRILRPAIDGKERLEEIRKIKNPKKRQIMLYNLCKNVEKCEREEKDPNSNLSQNSMSETTDYCSNGCGYKQPLYKRDPNDPLKIIIDIQEEEEDNDGKEEALLGYDVSDVLKYFLSDGSFIAIRPSGTEPKVKVYLSTKDETYEKAIKKSDDFKEFMSGILK